MRIARLALAASVALAGLAFTREASAFCGFYVGGADTALYNNATQVVLMREGTRTVLSMQNNYQGPPQNFAMVIPVPVVLQKENVKTLPRQIFADVDKMDAPRLVEYWEQDPCPRPQTGAWGDRIGDAFGAGGLGLSGIGSGGGGLGVTIEAKFEVGEYEIVVLGAQDSAGLDTWLRNEGYKIPAGAEPYLRPYVQEGMKFFVAKVNASKVKFENGQAMLSPLRFHYDSEKFALPVRLGLMNSAGAQDLIVHVLARGQRYEVANYTNVAIPTNLDVSGAAKKSFGAFYAALFDRTVEKSKNAVVTEYSWDASSCDPCPGPTLTMSDFATLGADALPTTTMGPANVALESPTFSSTGALPAEVVTRILRSHVGRLRACSMNAGSAGGKPASGTVSLRIGIDPSGAVAAVADEGSTVDPAVLACDKRGMMAPQFPAASGATTARISAKLVAGVPQPRFNGGFVLTRLHARYGKDTLGADLVFRAAPPIQGGREVSSASGKLEKGATPAGTNNFQGRYIIRHPWTGPITCANPQRGIWGGPPGGTEPKPVPALNLAFSPRNMQLASFVREDIPELSILAAPKEDVDVPADPKTEPTAAPSSAPIATGEPSSSGVEAAKVGPRARGCGCEIATPTDLRAATIATALASLLLFVRRRRDK